MSLFRTLALAVLVSFGGLASATTAQAGEYAAFVVHNPTDQVIHYQVKWGDGSWKPFTLRAGEEAYHAYPWDEDGYAPFPYIRFDWIAGDGEVTYRTYRVGVYDVNNRWSGKKYTLRYSGRYLDLYE
jgi:hypothetical protein